MDERPQPRTIQLNPTGPPRHWIAETSEPNQWELHWNTELSAQIARWILRYAERTALRNGGESLVITAGPDQHGMVKALLNYAQHMEVQQEDDRYVINLLSPSSDGKVDETPQPRTIPLGKQDPPLNWLAETSEPNQWELHWSTELNAQIARWILRDAEIAALRNGGESLVVTAGPDQHGMVKALLNYAQHMEVQQEDDRYVINLLCPSSDGLVHDDDDQRPLRHITCTTCVYRFTQFREQKRDEVMEEGLGAAAAAVETRLVAEAWLRLAEIEELLAENRDEIKRKSRLAETE